MTGAAPGDPRTGGPTATRGAVGAPARGGLMPLSPLRSTPCHARVSTSIVMGRFTIAAATASSCGFAEKKSAVTPNASSCVKKMRSAMADSADTVSWLVTFFGACGPSVIWHLIFSIGLPLLDFVAVDSTHTAWYSPSGMSDAFFASFCSAAQRSEEHTSELQSLRHLVCR